MSDFRLDIVDVFQARDTYLKFTITIDGQPAEDLKDALFEMFSRDGSILEKRITTGGITQEDNTITIHITDTDSLELSGNYNYELSILDTLDNSTQVRFGRITFTSTVSRIE